MSILLALALGTAPAYGCAGPRPGWLVPGVQPSNVHLNRITLSGRDRILWNGAPITRRSLRQYLVIVAAMQPRPLTILVRRHDADCALVEAIRDEIGAALPCAAGVCGEDLQPSPPPPPPPRRPRTSLR